MTLPKRTKAALDKLAEAIFADRNEPNAIHSWSLVSLLQGDTPQEGHGHVAKGGCLCETCAEFKLHILKENAEQTRQAAARTFRSGKAPMTH